MTEIPVGTNLTFECPGDYRLASDWKADPIAEVTCEDTGKFRVPADWGVCSSSMYLKINF